MELASLFSGLRIKNLTGPTQQEITGISYNSKKVMPGDVYFALEGSRHDGHSFLLEAIGRGAAAVVVERDLRIPSVITGIHAENTREMLAICSARYYGNPTSDIPVVGITGTNGKTTTAHIVESIMNKAGLLPSMFGTIENRFGDLKEQANQTTPESLETMRSLLKFITAGSASLVMEVSSHALAQHRVDGINFDVGVFTNLTRDHLDFHGDMESYYHTKTRLFKKFVRTSHGRSVINIDDEFGKRLSLESYRPIRISLDQGDICPEDIYDISSEGIKSTIKTPMGYLEVDSPLIGEYNLSNVLCAIGAGVALGIPLSKIEEGVNCMRSVPGRMETFTSNGVTAIIDYAHTDDALANVLKTTRKIAKKRIITIFGCGGDRDRTKRPAMAKVSAEMSDISIITSDNPRTEDPAQIFDDIKAGIKESGKTIRDINKIKNTGVALIEDRSEAIAKACGIARPGDTIIIAGKGHENYQIIGEETIFFSDKEEIEKALR